MNTPADPNPIPTQTQRVDARWIMAYSAALGDCAATRLDTASATPIVAHPLFPVCLEWPTVMALSGRDEHALENPGGTAAAVHASHDVHIHRPIRPDDELTTSGAMCGIEQRRPGVYSTMHMRTVDATGTPVATTWQGSLALGRQLSGAPREANAPPWPAPAEHPAQPLATAAIPIAAGAAHIYTECARIWNPIHTDRAVACRSGLPDIILHGTASLALAVSKVVELMAAGDGTRVRRITGRFTAQVLLPSTLHLQIAQRERHGQDEILFFELCNPDGAAVIRAGSITLAAAAP